MSIIKIRTVDLSKTYSLKKKNEKIVALNKVNLKIKKGEIFGLLGPNGAGKTTLIQILTTLRSPTQGNAFIDGHSVVNEKKQVRNRISLMLGRKMLYYRITAKDNLKFFCRFYGVSNYEEKIKKWVKIFDLDKWLNQYVENFSDGMKTKLSLCRTFLLERDILILDEPFLGLDITSLDNIKSLLRESKKTILLTTHNIEVAESLCDRIAILNFGSVISELSATDLKKIKGNDIKVEIEVLNNLERLGKELQAVKTIKNIEEYMKGLIVTLQNRESYNDLMNILRDFKIRKINEHEQTLQDFFKNINKRET